MEEARAPARHYELELAALDRHEGITPFGLLIRQGAAWRDAHGAELKGHHT